MKTVFQVVLIREYGNPNIIFEALKYDDILNWIEINKLKYINKQVLIQQATVIKKSI